MFGIKSKQEATRLIKQGSVKLDGVVYKERWILAELIKDGSIIQVGKNKFARLRIDKQV